MFTRTRLCQVHEGELRHLSLAGSTHVTSLVSRINMSFRLYRAISERAREAIILILTATTTLREAPVSVE